MKWLTIPVPSSFQNLPQVTQCSLPTDLMTIDVKYANPIVVTTIMLDQLATIPSSSLSVNLTTPRLSYSIDYKYEWSVIARKYCQHIRRPLPLSSYVVVSAGGSTQLIAAAYYAIQKYRKSSSVCKIQFTRPAPNYMLFQNISKTVPGCVFVEPGVERDVDVHVMVSPNNPTGEIQQPAESFKPNKWYILDSVYDIPQFV